MFPFEFKPSEPSFRYVPLFIVISHCWACINIIIMIYIFFWLFVCFVFAFLPFCFSLLLFLGGRRGCKIAEKARSPLMKWKAGNGDASGGQQGRRRNGGLETGSRHFTTSPPGTWLSFQNFIWTLRPVLIFFHFDFPFLYENADNQRVPFISHPHYPKCEQITRRGSADCDKRRKTIVEGVSRVGNRKWHLSMIMKELNLSPKVLNAHL